MSLLPSNYLCIALSPLLSSLLLIRHNDPRGGSP